MPELPEVESFVRALKGAYEGKIISRTIFHRADIRYPLDERIRRNILAPKRRLLRIFRDGKQLVFETEGGAVDISLGMSGRFIPAIPDAPAKHEHVSVFFEDESGIGFVDPRRFGHMKIRDAQLPHLADPLDRDALIRLFRAMRSRNGRSIKDALMDQGKIGGLGNIYALEALHRAGIRPQRRARKISEREYLTLAKIIPSLLREAIEKGGSSVKTYRGLHGSEGAFQQLHRVYGRDGMPCMKKGCEGVIKRIVQSGRGSWYCPKCQR